MRKPSLILSDPVTIADIFQVNRNIVPAFYRVLQEQDQQKQIENAQELRIAFDTLIEAAHPRGPFFMGGHISFVDIQAAPWVIRLNRVLKPYRGWPNADEGSRLASWVNAIETNDQVRATTSTDELYLESYARYAGEFQYLVHYLGKVLTMNLLNNREPPEHISACKCDQFGTFPSLNPPVSPL